jgi:putative redox protein
LIRPAHYHSNSRARALLNDDSGRAILSMLRRRSDELTDRDAKAVVKFAGDDLFVAISPSGHAMTIETDTARSSAATPMELLLLALGGCTGVDVISILRKKREHVTSYHVELRGQRREEHPRAYTRIEVKHVVRGRKLTERAVAQAIELSEQKYCSVAATLRPTAEIVSSYEILEDEGED